MVWSRVLLLKKAELTTGFAIEFANARSDTARQLVRRHIDERSSQH